jgi:hypothetical protein
LKSGAKVKETEELKKEKDEYTKELGYSDDLLNHNLINEFSQKEQK